MTQTAAITKSLLEGNVLSIMNGFKLFSCTNLPREISRSVEQKFGCIVSRTKVDFTSKYGQKGIYYQYRFNPLIEGNSDAAIKMREYVSEHFQTSNIKEESKSSALTIFQ